MESSINKKHSYGKCLINKKFTNMKTWCHEKNVQNAGGRGGGGLVATKKKINCTGTMYTICLQTLIRMGGGRTVRMFYTLYQSFHNTVNNMHEKLVSTL
jgi:hypothetical protein